jgi:branched-chain amino acid transport system substrate-binding protein
MAQGSSQNSRMLPTARGALRTAFFVGVFSLAAIGWAKADVSVGVLIPSSGKGAAYGQQQQAAIDMFMEKYADLGKAGKLKLVVYDTRGENTDAINLTRKLIGSDEVVAIVGPEFSGEAEVSFPLAARGETMMVTPMAAKPGIAAANRPWAFRFALTSENDYGPLIDAWVKHQSKPIKTVVILMDAKDGVSSADGKSVFPAVLKKHGIRILDTISFETGDIDYSAQVTRAKSLASDGIVVSALYNEAGHVTAEIRKQGMTQPIVAGIGVNDPRFIAIAGSAAEGVMAASDFFAKNPAPKVAAWSADFEKRNGKPPSNAAALMYDTLYLMRSCIMETGVDGKKLQSDRTKLRDCWTNMKNKDAPLTGETSINKDGDAERKPVVLVVKGDGFVPLQ